MTQIVNLGVLLQDEAQLKNVGSEITKRALIAAMEQKMNLQPSYAPNMRTIKVGDVVPPDLVGKLTVRPDGSAAKGWTDGGWTDLGIWERSTWSQEANKTTIKIGDIRTLPLLEKTKLLSRLTQEEMGVLKSMGYID